MSNKSFSADDLTSIFYENVRILSFIFLLYFMIRPFLDVKSKFVMAVVTSVIVIVKCGTESVSLASIIGTGLSGILLGFISFLCFRWKIPALCLVEENENLELMKKLGLAIVLPVTWATLNDRSVVLLCSLYMLLLWGSGNYMLKRWKSVGTVMPMALGTSLPIPLMGLGVVLYCSMERAISILETWPRMFGTCEVTFTTLTKAHFMPDSKLPSEYVKDFNEMCNAIQGDNRHLLVANFFFPYGVRWDTLICYAFGAISDDLVDEDVDSEEERRKNLSIIKEFLVQLFSDRKKDENYIYSSWQPPNSPPVPFGYPRINWPYFERNCSSRQLANMRCLSRIVYYLPPETFFELFRAFGADVECVVRKDENEVEKYAQWDTGFAGILLTYIFLGKANLKPTLPCEKMIYHAAKLGRAFGLNNFARDIVTDSEIGRVVIPLSWLEDETHLRILKEEKDPYQLGEDTVRRYSLRFLDYGEQLEAEGVKGIPLLPPELRVQVRLATNIYKGIANAIRESEGYPRRVSLGKLFKVLMVIKTFYCE